MDTYLIAIVLFAVLFVLLGAGLWIAVALPVTGLLGLALFISMPIGKMLALGGFNWNNSFLLTALPLFIFMGAVLLRSGISEQLFSAVSPWLSRLPGGLLHTNVVTCAIFAAVSGSSVATTATISTVAIPEEKRRGYNKRLMLGSLCGAGSLGLLIPPSLGMIIYGVIVGESIGKLFIGGILPGIMMATMFMIYIGCVSILRPQVGVATDKLPFKQMIKGLPRVTPTVVLIFFVLGGIYVGWTTPTEAAALGAAGAMIISLAMKTLKYQVLKEALLETVKMSGMVLFIVTGASIFAASISYLGLAADIAEFTVALPVSKYVILGVVAVLYLVMGCFLDGASAMLMTLPILYPTMMGLGFDSVWFGVVVVILTEIGQLTPPLGFNLFVLQSISGESIGEIASASLPFFFILLLGFVILTIYPEIVLFLPNLMISR